jgi:hypothetical protein
MLLKIFPLISPQQEHFRTTFQLILEAIVSNWKHHGMNMRFTMKNPLKATGNQYEIHNEIPKLKE